jgi:hypothetical protein
MDITLKKHVMIILYVQFKAMFGDAHISSSLFNAVYPSLSSESNVTSSQIHSP